MHQLRWLLHLTVVLAVQDTEGYSLCPAPLVFCECTKCGGVSIKPVCVTCMIVEEYEAAQAKKN